MVLTYEMGILDGRREVVEYFKSRRVETDLLGAARFYASNDEWQAKLKEWGIDKPQSEDIL